MTAQPPWVRASLALSPPPQWGSTPVHQTEIRPQTAPADQDTGDSCPVLWLRDPISSGASLPRSG